MNLNKEVTVKWEFCVSGTGLILKASLCQGKQGFLIFLQYALAY